ncbi:MAG TPA: SAM-dependent methyltransferase [Candidatus Acidoferrales bacterium]
MNSPEKTPQEKTPLARELAARISANGPITLSDYMESCLYDPDHGYYSNEKRTRFADYFTSVDVHPIFGRLLARQLEQIWQILDRPSEFVIVESGAGIGRLARHILDFAASHLPDFYSALHYVAVECSAARRATHKKNLAAHFAVDHVKSSAELPGNISAGCILSNEMFDAMPVHRVIQQYGELHEIKVGYADGIFVDHISNILSPGIANYFARQEIKLVEGQHAEANLAACNWISDAAHRLNRGYLLTIDYGYPARELYNPRRMNGTLLAYRDHKVSENYYAAPGEQDLTAHVNFTALEIWGRDAGLETLGLIPQSRFLVSLGRKNEFADLYDEGQSETDRVRAQLQLSSLIHPEGMGQTFQVFIQQKGIKSNTPLIGLSPL